MSICCRFYSPIVEKGSAIGFPTLELSDSELTILWYLCENGPKCAYELDQASYYLPLNTHAPDFIIGKLSSKKLANLKEKRRYSRPFIVKILRRLERKGLLKIAKDTSRDRIRQIAQPTFSGLMLYLTNSPKNERFKHVFGHYSDVIPFSGQWHIITNKLGKEKCGNALEQTVKDFVEIAKIRFHLRRLGMEFEGFLESPRMLMREIHESIVEQERDIEVAKYLESREAQLLRDSYIAYLLVHDIRILAGENPEQIEILIPRLKSEKEFAYFEKAEAGSGLLKGKQLEEFLPKYAGIEYFFTGMFVNNLLWVKKKIEKVIEEPVETDFEVEYL